MSASQLKKFDSLQIFCGLAALGVVFHHTAISTSTVVVDVLYHLLIEKPLIRLFRQLFNRLKSA